MLREIRQTMRGFAVLFSDSAGEHTVDGFAEVYGALRFCVDHFGLTQQEAQRLIVS